MCKVNYIFILIKVFPVASSGPEVFPIKTPRELIVHLCSKVKWATLVESDPKAPFPITTTLRCRAGCYTIPRIAPLYP